MELTPQGIVQGLDKYIVGQEEAKRCVATAICNRERRRRLPPELRQEVLPKNILMVGPTGVGKTEIARRLAKIMDAPFIRVEATKFTEVGYVGRDVDSIVSELVESSTVKAHEEAIKKVEAKAEKVACQRLLDYLYHQLPRERSPQLSLLSLPDAKPKRRLEGLSLSRRHIAKLFHNHKLDEEEVEIEVEAESMPEMKANPDDYWEEGFSFRGLEGQRKWRKMKVKEARRMIAREEASKLIDFEQVVDEAIKRTEERGVVFIDEIDKLCAPQIEIGRDVSGEGVQRDMLPILDGSAVMTRFGQVKTEHILFVAAGAFTKNKPTDLIPEFQGRFPLKVELKPLSQKDLERILVEPQNSLIRQNKALLATEEVELVFSQDGISEIAKVATLMNEGMENIGARRLYTVMEKVLEELSFSASERRGEKVLVNRDYVLGHIGQLLKEENLNQYIL